MDLSSPYGERWPYDAARCNAAMMVSIDADPTPEVAEDHGSDLGGLAACRLQSS